MTAPEWGPGWPNCQGDKLTTVTGGGIRVTVRREIAPLVKAALDRSAATGYRLDQTQTGGYNCRPIGGTRTPSNHSWGLAVDVNWRDNPFTHDANARRTITPEVVNIWKSLGFNWGGDWSGKKDFMHMEFRGTPADAGRRVADLTGTPPPPPSSPPFPGRILKRGVKGEDVRTWQQKMRDRGWSRMAVDGDYGPTSADLCTQFQREKGLGVDGEVGPQTWAATWR